MAKKLVIMGAGTFASEVIQLIHSVNKKDHYWEILGVLDDNRKLHGSYVCSEKVRGGFD